MNDVQRFTWNREDEVVDPSDNGEYVKYEDYLSLSTRLFMRISNLTVENVDLHRVRKENKELREEIERLQKVVKDITGDDDLTPRYSKNRVRLMIKEALRPYSSLLSEE